MPAGEEETGTIPVVRTPIVEEVAGYPLVHQVIHPPLITNNVGILGCNPQRVVVEISSTVLRMEEGEL
jgi:hypothetical protein